MLSKSMLGIINILPDKVVAFIAKYLLDSYINKYANIKTHGMEKIKDIKAPIIFICNHLSNADGIIMNRLLKDNNVTFVAGVKLTDNRLTKLGFFVAKTIQVHPNSPDKDAISKIVNTLKQGNNIMMFPEGTRSRSGKMIEGKRGLILMAKLSKATILPMGIWGTEKLLPIDESDMALERFHHADVNISIGDSIMIPSKNKDEARDEYYDRVMNEIMSGIAVLLPEQYRGVYSQNK
ncbi:lysophospholipid acyltransferase family protein [Clostridium estertheticum]|uniref:Acyl-phosphate glycerol 3-phosphate acyltransferase n=2 Tax=Clostridium estertheticum TaxID=238834 RepID=A0A1J0GBU9_9CLOT|nr:lysophospholipid acyltransferase family protein [Clostridium estertheticum]APC38817.1 acyl-phosphate glycerol 3-phosphate acyltransferase [Clostridium estertheticum subsp. estertheticum]MBU3074570.1 1-acyl-sn-glycerol-3-phosphate acyltransferase [Clostridium estertheticum]MBU3164718.1 1-acyl-sn-glycerol-3-phosphate acyltransferase [Clostridium estertheticum]MBU3171302.1 1-acyl-sn-glycerol-3-phosphate acyltransferase [Clostridium estertheticum]MBU3185709.1 1-acyl-sn-glycerol-3-phosphate acyl